MINITFFILILSILAFGINYIWELNDSYKYEQEEIKRINRQCRSQRKNVGSSTTKGFKFYSFNSEGYNECKKSASNIDNCA